MSSESTEEISDILTAEEVARWLRYTPARVRQMARSGILPCLAIPTGKRKSYRFSRRAIEIHLARFCHVATDSVTDDA